MRRRGRIPERVTRLLDKRRAILVASQRAALSLGGRSTSSLSSSFAAPLVSPGNGVWRWFQKFPGGRSNEQVMP